MKEEWDGAERRDGERRDDATLNDVHAGIVDVAASMSQLAEAITLSASARSRIQTWWLGILTVGVILLAVMAAVQLRITTEGETTRNLIADCTTPKGECYQRSIEAQTRVVGQIKDDSDAAAERAVRQVECDIGIFCFPGFSPTSTVPPGTTTTTTKAPSSP